MSSHSIVPFGTVVIIPLLAILMGFVFSQHTKEKKQKQQTPFLDPRLPYFRLVHTDSYKGAHSEMLDTVVPGGIRNMQCYFSTRTGSEKEVKFAIFVGLQPLLKTLANSRITRDEVDRMEALFKRGIGLGSFNRTPWDFVIDECDGVMPIEISALPEGTKVPRGVPFFKIQSTRPEFAAAIGYLESFLSQSWFPVTIATKCYELKQVLQMYCDKTGTPPQHVPFMLHDFGVRGTSSMASASMGGMGHLSIFRGTDNLPAIDAVDTFYGMEDKFETPGGSVNATEHSVMTSGGFENEKNVIDTLLASYPGGILSMVIDSFDQRDVVDYLTTSHVKEIVIKRDGKLVFRPDSGDPLIVLGMILDKFEKNMLDLITVNKLGFKVLPKGYGIIYGDGLDSKKIVQLLDLLVARGFSVENIVFGAGGALLQKGLDEVGLNRDTLRCSFKLCALQTNDGIWRPIFKDPIDGRGEKCQSKASLRGRQKVIHNVLQGQLTSVDEDDIYYKTVPDEMYLVYRNGVLFNQMTFDSVRENISAANPNY